ncbi:unnamed protein product, partial [Scytosiphon promiscuus]
QVKNAVIGVPASFGVFQKTAIHTVAMVCGLHRWRPVVGSAAAALGYPDVESCSRCPGNNLLIFDLGGGTTSVSVVVMEEGVCEVRSTVSHAHHGGEDIDMAMSGDLRQELWRKTQRDLSLDPRAVRRLHAACERAKRELSSSTAVNIDIDALYEGMDFNSTITRARFEHRHGGFLGQCLRLVEAGLEQALMGKKGKNQIDTVLLVGGSTRIPKVRQILKDFFDGKEPCTPSNRDE